MEASIKANRITDFVRLLQCASRFGDDLNISANKDLWELAVTNSSKSAFCLFKLHGAFFCRYKALGTTVEQRRGVKCQLLVKSLLAVLGKTSAAGNVERVDLKIHDPDHSLGGKRRRRGRKDTTESNGRTTDEDESEEEEVGNSIESILIMKLVCKHGVIKRHSLHLGQTEFLRADVDPDTTPSGFLIDARTLRDWLDHFHIGLTSSHVMTSAGTTTIRQENQLSWLFSRDEVRVKSWEGGSRELSTEIKVDPGEFVDYEVFTGRVDLTLPMREFRATLALADQLSIRLVVAFSEAGQPFTLTSEVFDDGDPIPFEIFCAIATTTCDQFVTVKTPSDPPTSNGAQGSRSRSVTGFLNRTNSGTRNGSMNGHTQQRSGSLGSGQADETGGDGGEGVDDGDGDGVRNVRRRTGSERPSSVRPRLSMSNRPSHVSNSMTTGLARTATVSGAGESNPHENSHVQGTSALFLPGGSQADLDDTTGTGAGPSNTQTQTHTHTHSHSQTQPRLSQREVEELTGLDNLDAVMEAMDDEQHEEELEELRASQRQQSPDQESQGGEEYDTMAAIDQPVSPIQIPPRPVPPAPLLAGTTSQAERRPSQPRLPLGDITLEMDETIFGLAQRVQDVSQVPREEETSNNVDEAMDQVIGERHTSPEITIEPAPFGIADQEQEVEAEAEAGESRDKDMAVVVPEGEANEVEVAVAAEVEEEVMNQEVEVIEDDEDLPATQIGTSVEVPSTSFVRKSKSEAMTRKFTELFDD